MSDKGLTVQQLARKFGRHSTYFSKLARTGKLAAAQVPGPRGRKRWLITTPVADIAALVAADRGGWHKRQAATAARSPQKRRSGDKGSQGRLLADFLAYRALDSRKRAILAQLGTLPIDVLRLLAEIAKS